MQHFGLPLPLAYPAKGDESADYTRLMNTAKDDSKDFFEGI